MSSLEHLNDGVIHYKNLIYLKQKKNLKKLSDTNEKLK
jgi:hypothetical protein